jgi:omega-6 fatty acid desaturase (delta-12 desaturase)
VTSIDRIKQDRRSIVEPHLKADNLRAFAQVLNTLVPLGVLWYAAVQAATVSWWLTAGITLLMSLFLLRVFVLMHDCGHGSMFGTAGLNRAFGFVFGVISGMPQYVWSQHHAFHHSTNGNWAKYTGPLAVVTVGAYAAMNGTQQRQYRRARNIWLAPLAGFLYILWHPRVNWIKGSISLLGHLVRGKPAAEFTTRYWATREEYWHMTWNNVALLGGCALMCWIVGPALFLPIYVVSTSLAGAGGIVLFAVQHNFEHAYASGDEGWDYVTAAIRGTSFLVLPRWLNWFTSDIAYHHVHHLSAKIPNYRLTECHEENRELFSEVPRIRLSGIPAAMKCILWDTDRRRIISVAEYEKQLVGTA